MAAQGHRLAVQALEAALATIAAWRANPAVVTLCPACGVPGLRIIDRSARPHVEWYAISCSACGLDESLHIPLGAPPQSIE